YDEWLWDEFYNAWDVGMYMARRKAHPVNMIVDVTATCGFPSGALGQLLGMTVQPHLNLHRVVLVRDDPMTAAIAMLLQRYRGKRTECYFHAATVEAAIELCESKLTDQVLPSKHHKFNQQEE
ncbi:MAG: hypothetical protein AAFV33_14595, partial [Chloroflexota bacterium]